MLIGSVNCEVSFQRAQTARNGSERCRSSDFNDGASWEAYSHLLRRTDWFFAASEVARFVLRGLNARNYCCCLLTHVFLIRNRPFSISTTLDRPLLLARLLSYMPYSASLDQFQTSDWGIHQAQLVNLFISLKVDLVLEIHSKIESCWGCDRGWLCYVDPTVWSKSIDCENLLKYSCPCLSSHLLHS